MFTSLLFKGGIVLVLVTACLFFAWRIVRILNPRPPRPPKYTEYFVVEVRNGATIIVSKKEKEGRRGRRTKSLNLEGIAAPAEGEQWFTESRDNLALFAGAKVRVQVRGLFRSVTPGEETYMVWFEKHYNGCEVCSIIPTPENPEPLLCEEAKARMEKAVADDPDTCAEVPCLLCEGHGKIICFPDMLHREEYEAVCFRCGGDGKVYQATNLDNPKDRNVVVGTVWGESGACLNLEQLRSGMVFGVGDISEEWQAAESIAKKKGLGIWNKP